MEIATFTTDFGDADSYVAEMKGSMLTTWARMRPGAPAPVLVDVTHAIPRHDILRASLVLTGAIDAFPAGTVHVVVVDPGVGSTRRPIAVRAGSQAFVGPDNGCLTPALRQPDALTVCISPAWRRSGAASRVFDGRDLFAPAAAAILAGVPLEDLGSPVTNAVALEPPEASYRPGAAAGIILVVDHFGNARTSLRSDRIPVGACVHLGAARVARIVDAYADLDPGETGGVRSSDGSLEIAMRQGDAAATLGLGPGDRVEVTW